MPAPPPPPAPRPHPGPVACSSESVAGYTCYEHQCATDGSHTDAGSCGTDLCHPNFSKPPPTDPAVVALCTVVPSGANATTVAAARCSAFKGCTTVARSPAYGPSHCRGGAGVCFKFFTSGKDGLSADGSWTAWVKHSSQQTVV